MFQFVLLLKLFEEAGEDYQRHNSEDYLSKGLGISQTVEREELVEKPQRGYLEHNFAQNGKYKRVSSHTDGLEHTDGEKVNAHEGSGYAHAAQEARAIANDYLAVHKQAYEEAGADEVQRGDNSYNNDRGHACETYGVLHALAVSGGVVVANERHDALGEAKRDVHGQHVYLLRNAHGRDGVGLVG